MTVIILRNITILWLCLIGTLYIQAQSDTIIGLQSDNSALETGQYYTVNLIVRDASEVWQVNTIIEYDPALLYVIGTVAGQPMAVGDFFGEQQAVVVRNGIDDGQLIYTQSLLAPALPQDGSGTVASFQVYPLSAGTTQMRFVEADLTKINYTEDAAGNRTVTDTEDLPVLPALVEFTISGETVPPPDESTATPEPTLTSAFVGRDGDDARAEPTLINVTLAPDTVPTLIPEIEESNTSEIPILPIALGLLIVGSLGIAGLFMASRRS